MMTPGEHFQEADRLLAGVDDSQLHLPFAASRIAKAMVHATLAQCDPYAYEDYPHNGYVAYPPMETRVATRERL